MAKANKKLLFDQHNFEVCWVGKRFMLWGCKIFLEKGKKLLSYSFGFQSPFLNQLLKNPDLALWFNFQKKSISSRSDLIIRPS